VSKGLGSTQCRALEILDDAPCLSVRELAEALGCSERFARTVVTSLERRRLVYVRTDDGRRRVFFRRPLPLSWPLSRSSK